MNLMLVGAGGMLAQDLRRVLSQKSINCQAFEEHELDITHPEKVDAALSHIHPEVLINCAAYTQVDQAESDSAKAMLINRDAPLLLAKACLKHQSKLLHISTDFVFDGTSNKPYTESVRPNPLSVYGKSKHQGEVAIQQSGANYLIVRTAWLYGVAGHNFVKTMLRLSRERQSLKVVHDQIGSPTWTVDLANALVDLITRQATGLVHYSNREQCSWYEFAKTIIEQAYQLQLIEKIIPVHPIPTTDYPTPAKRPAFSVLDCGQYTRLTQKIPPAWYLSLGQMLTELKKTE
ncbi:dTDP-4-dehydrorhamnose reductase [Deltaproteobacteria bacterium TL4]